MSTSLRDQLLKVGLISKQQAHDAERQSQRQSQRQSRLALRPTHSKQKPNDRQAVPSSRSMTAPRPHEPTGASAKLLRDRELNRRQQADTKARMAQIEQWIDQHRLEGTLGAGEPGDAAPAAGTSADGAPAAQFYNFVDGEKIRRIAVDESLRDRLIRGDVVIVKFNARYELVPAAIGSRIGERDPSCIVATAGQRDSAPTESAYERFVVPDDLIW